jgi:hypothetical protein
MPSHPPVEQSNTISILSLQEAFQKYEIAGNLNIYQAVPTNQQSDFLKAVDDYVQQLHSLGSVSLIDIDAFLEVRTELEQFISRLSRVENNLECADDDTQQRTPGFRWGLAEVCIEKIYDCSLLEICSYCSMCPIILQRFSAQQETGTQSQRRVSEWRLQLLSHVAGPITLSKKEAARQTPPVLRRHCWRL